MPFTPLQPVGRANQVKQSSGPGYLSRVGQSLKETATTFGSDIQKQANELNAGGGIGTLARSGLRAVGATARAVFTPVLESPGVKQATEFVGEKLSDTAPMQKFASWAQKHPEAAKDIQDVLDVASLFGGKAASGPVARSTVGLARSTGEATAKTFGNIADRAVTMTRNAPSDIMTRVARLTPKEEMAFKNTSGRTVGEYLTETGNFGDPQSIVAKEAEKFASSKNMVDDALSKLPGEYQVGPVNDALQLIVKKGEGSSTSSVKAPYLSRATELLQKSQNQGLNMSEINEVKRLLEREVRLGYNKLNKPQTVARATYVDDAIRQWQFKKAPELGLENLPELNKQTQVSKFLLNKLGDSIVGKGALNNMSLTDWIILAGGDGTAASSFLVKKFFSSKGIQAKIAKMLNRKPVQEIITPKTRVIEN